MTDAQRQAIELSFDAMDASGYFDGLRAGLVDDWAAVDGYEANYPEDAAAWVARMQDAALPLLDDVDPALIEAIHAAE